MQSQLVCSGCRTVLLYPRGATNVCCAICNVVTSVPPAGMEMSQLICGGCRTLLMHARGAASVRCSCCHTVNLVPAPAAPATTPPPTHNNIAHVNCGNCHAMLMYPAGAPSVKCAICHFITNVNISDTRVPFHVHRTGGISTSASTSTYPFSWYYVFGPAMGYFLQHCFKDGYFMQNNKHGVSHSHNQTVVVQNPMTVDETGKLVNNVVVGVTT